MKGLNNIMFRYIFFLFIIIINDSCDSAEASTSNQDAVNAFKKVGAKDKKLFTQKDRATSYKSSLESGKTSLDKNKAYSGYGSSSKKNSKERKIKEKKKNTKIKYSLKKRKNKSSNNFSAYTTN
tara:strand:+ start:165 stop:536 length:372 start_codon:yes stop_codon:yes gene_type:complete